MDQIITFIDFETEQGLRGRRLQPDTISIWYNLESKQKTYGATLAQNIETEKEFVKIGRIGNDLCLVFSDEPGIKIHFSKGQSQRRNITFQSKGFVSLIFGDIEKGKDRKVFELSKVTAGIYILKGEK